MLKTETDDTNSDEDGNGGTTGVGHSWGRVCDTCRSAACTVYCRADSAFLCSDCDARIHAANRVASRHERVFLCEACERAPAAFICKADAASLCIACDADIHSANPLASRHHRVPIVAMSGTVHGPRSSNVAGLVGGTEDGGYLGQEENEAIDEEDEEEAASWLLLNPAKNSLSHSNINNNNNNQRNGFLFAGEDDEYLDLVEFNSCGGNQFAEERYEIPEQQYSSAAQKNYGGDSVVPVQNEIKEKLHHQNQNFQLGLQYDASSKAGIDFNGFVNHSVSISSMDVGIVPETRGSDIAISHPRPLKGTIDLFSSPPVQIPTQLSPVDREARVLRYREKKKNRKFEKTIRYASRKAYAETRPRIKGRFAKRTDMEIEVDQKLSMSFMVESGYGVVPSF